MNFQEKVNRIYGPTLYNNYSEFIISVIEKNKISISEEQNTDLDNNDKNKIL